MVDKESHGSRQLNAYACLFITLAAATVALVLRLIARRLTKVSLWLDDYLAILAYACALVWCGLMLWWLESGFGLFLNEIDMPMDQALERSRLILWNIELFYAFSLAFAKLAILGFYWRMFKTSNIKVPIQVLGGCTLVWLVLRTFLAIFHCVPVAKFWKTELPGHCVINDSDFFFGTVLAHLCIDIAILALPVFEVRKLHLPLSQRLGIMGMFGFGIFVCVASVVVLILSLNYDTASPEMPWNVSPIIIWATAEVNLAIVSACLPMLRPIWLFVARRPLSKPSLSSASYGQSYGQTHSHTTGHKLTTLTIHKDSDKLESESTHELAERGGSISSISDYERGPHGITTTIVGMGLDEERGVGVPIGTRTRSNSSDGQWGPLMGGIMVTNETSVRIDKIA